MTTVLVIVAALAVIAAALPIILEKRRQKIGSRERQGAPGKFAKLSQGVTYYRWFGPTRGPVIVAIHGLTTPSRVWEAIVPSLGHLGYRVLTYDLYGRGLSDAPTGLQDRQFFLTQLNDLLAHEGLGEDLTLMGYSMGGSISVAFAQEQGHRVARLILLAPAGVIQNESSFSSFCRRLPIIGDWLHGVLAERRLRAAQLQDDTVSDVDDIARYQLAQLERQGFLPAVLMSRRGMLSEVQEEAHRQIGREDIPVFAVWGGRDQVIPVSSVGELARWNRLARQEVVDGADHALPFSHASAVNEKLRKLLSER